MLHRGTFSINLHCSGKAEAKMRGGREVGRECFLRTLMVSRQMSLPKGGGRTLEGAAPLRGLFEGIAGWGFAKKQF